ncbi:hypothetical protein [Paenibacillus sp. Mc5Re-14]|uniref:hypothetical protein n=1 Tax=Paenibacillus sp. Mc5Re-14 TaxID=1030529 RepID=UPI000B07A594|nr:hypothetical protein [Paenibacillus sp. Mc5Re-14]
MSAHKDVCDLFNEVLEELKKEYAAYNFERGICNVNKDGITERERLHLHNYREKLSQIYIP